MAIQIQAFLLFISKRLELGAHICEEARRQLECCSIGMGMDLRCVT